MLVASVNDPAAIVEATRGATSLALLVERLRHMLHCHVLICDTAGQMVEGLKNAAMYISDPSHHVPLQVGKLLEELVVGRPIIRCPAKDNVLQTALALIPDLPATASAIAMMDTPGVDIVVLSSEGEAAMKSVGVGFRRACRIEEYPFRDVMKRERRCMEGVPTGRMREQEFCASVVKPFVKWMQSLIVFDKVLVSAFFDPPERSNWPEFQRTLRAVFATWKSTAVVKRSHFAIVSNVCTWNRKRHESRWHQEVFPPPSKQAQMVGKALALGPELEVRMLRLRDAKADVREAGHDRYLMSNRSVALKFTRGFDLIREDGSLKPSSIHVCGREDREGIQMVLREPRVAVWP